MSPSTKSDVPSENSLKEPSLEDAIERFRSQDAANYFTRFPDARQKFFSDESNRGEAAVLVPLIYDQDQWRMMMTVRAKHLRSQAGYVAFPGGKFDDQDVDLRTTALREAHEEIGLPPNQVQVISQLPPLVAPNRHFVTPYVGLIPPTFVPTPDASEVAETFTAPARNFTQSRHHSCRWIEFRNRPFLLHAFDIPGLAGRHPFMGMSAKLAIVTAAVLYNRKPSFEVDPAFDISDISRGMYDIYFGKG
ncbi:uncharacterized Nudix hydrolase NudL-like [Lytechinus pictus]|uniref:uncharacterized Nudix hydrolase NudL-like n=1 Tax=Lytechinus pictus TaxID=7653 RepID=UPI0030B9D962